MRPLIAANWKMHGDMDWISKPAEFAKIMPVSKRQDIDVLICPPFPFIAPMVKNCAEAGILLGAQNCHAEDKGAHTGEVSAAMLKSAGAHYVIVGHSERRAGGEHDRDVQAKADATSRAGLTPIICVGESLEQREAGRAQAVVKDQIAMSVPEGLTDYVIAYEPIWAIGTGKTPTIADIEDMHATIRKQVGDNIRLLYGGSVKPANAKSILGAASVNGALIGGASLEMESLAAIAASA